MSATTDQVSADTLYVLFEESIEAMRERFREVAEKYPNDSEGLNHITKQELFYWFDKREVNPKFKL